MEKTKALIKEKLKQAKEKMQCWELSIEDYNKYVRHCRKLLTLLEVRRCEN